MKDVFKEQLVKKNYDEQDSRKKLSIIAIAIAVSVFFYNLVMYKEGGPSYADMMMVLITIGIIVFIAYKKVKALNVEFEYIYTNGFLEIDIIKNKSKRKKVFEGEVCEFEVMAHIDDKEHLGMYEQLPLQSFASGDKLGNTYVFVGNYNAKRKRFVIEPNEELLKAMAIDLTSRRMFKKK